MGYFNTTTAQWETPDNKPPVEVWFYEPQPNDTVMEMMNECLSVFEPDKLARSPKFKLLQSLSLKSVSAPRWGFLVPLDYMVFTRTNIEGHPLSSVPMFYYSPKFNSIYIVDEQWNKSDHAFKQFVVKKALCEHFLFQHFREDDSCIDQYSDMLKELISIVGRPAPATDKLDRFQRLCKSHIPLFDAHPIITIPNCTLVSEDEHFSIKENSKIIALAHYHWGGGLICFRKSYTDTASFEDLSDTMTHELIHHWMYENKLDSGHGPAFKTACLLLKIPYKEYWVEND